MNKLYSNKNRQTGSALIIGLTILMVILIIGTAGMRTTIMEEKMAGNVRDYNIAFQAAESALKDGEVDILNVDPVTNEPIRPGVFPADDDFSTDCNVGDSQRSGLCLPSTTLQPQWLTIDWTAPTNKPYRQYGQYTKIDGGDTPTLPSVSEQPRYIIEFLGSGGGSLAIGGVPRPVNKYYRVTAQGYGIATTDTLEPLARVMLQSTYGK